MKIQTFRKTALYAFIAAMAAGCGGGGSDTKDASVEQDDTLIGSGAIEKAGNVDWFEYKSGKADQVVNVKVKTDTVRPDVDLLVSAYTGEGSSRVLKMAKHAPENATNRPEVNINFHVENDETVYISVRDLNDDEFSESEVYKVYASSISLEDATSAGKELTYDAEKASCIEDQAIVTTGESNAYLFSVPATNTYKLTTYFPNAKESQVDLQVSLYDNKGYLQASLDHNDVSSHPETYPLVRYLTQGDYKLVVNDSGFNNFDAGSSYSVCLEQYGAKEAGLDDKKENATTLALGATATEKALEYDNDEDWYTFTPNNQTGGDNLEVLTLNLRTKDLTDEADPDFKFDIQVIDSNDKTLLTHERLAGSGDYNVELPLSEATKFYVVVKPADRLVTETDGVGNFIYAAPYELTVNTSSVTDAYENNNTLANAISIQSTETVSSKIAYRTDVDYYKIDVKDPLKVLEVTLNTDAASSVDYSVAIIGYSGDNAGVERLVDDAEGSDGVTSLKTSMLTRNVDNNTYYIRVRDMSDDDSDSSKPYTLVATVKDIADTAPTTDVTGVDNAIYLSETAEQNRLAVTEDSNKLNLQINDDQMQGTSVTYVKNLINLERIFSDNETVLAYQGDNIQAGVTQTQNEDGSTTITFPWIAGYVDYQGDNDLYRLNLLPLNEADETYYYTAQVEMKAAGSDVEFGWMLHREQTGSTMRLLKSNGRSNQSNANANGDYWATASDGDQAATPLDKTTGANGEFWGSKGWAGTYVLRVSDNNASSQDAPYADADWSVTTPYFVRLTLTYFPGKERP